MVVVPLCRLGQREGEVALACWHRCGFRKQVDAGRGQEDRREDHQEGHQGQRMRRVAYLKRLMIRGLLEDPLGCV